jgi:hypothetical protein
MPEDYDFDAAIVHHNRIYEINLHGLSGSQLQRLASAMQEQFPALIHLKLDLEYGSGCPGPALPDGFLGGSAPHLQSLTLRFTPFPALPKFLSSATGLVDLDLRKIPHSGYISPEAIVTYLAVMTNLKFLAIGFESPLSRPDRDRRRPPPPTRTVLPALSRFVFNGVSEYVEDLVDRIDAPLLDSIWITFFHQLVFDIPQIAQFMRRATRLQTLNEAHVTFDNYGVEAGSLPATGNFDETSGLRISCTRSDWQLSSLAQAIPLFFPSIYLVEYLYIYEPLFFPSEVQDEIENTQWLELFHPFSAVKNLYLSKEFAPSIAPALQELVGDRMTEVLPVLLNIYLEELQPSEPIQKGIAEFVAARLLSDHPVTVSLWERESKRPGLGPHG